MLKQLKTSLKYSLKAFRAGESFPSIFSTEAPSHQKAVDLFKGDWAAKFPIDGLISGNRPDLFEDPRIQWFLDYVGSSIQGKSILELGPLEGAHTSMLEKAGFGSVLGIEANGRAYLKCLVTKELMGLQHSHFLYGDFTKYLHSSNERFDFGLACGVFYHLRSPHECLRNLREKINGPVFIWTHYWTPKIRTEYPALWKRFSESRDVQIGYSKTIKLFRHEYETSIFNKGFFGGNGRYSEWIEENSLFQIIDDVGWKIAMQRDDSSEFGPAVSLILEPKNSRRNTLRH